MNIIPGELRDSFLQTASSCIFSVYISQRFCPPLLLWVTPPPDEQQNQNLYLSRRPQAVGFLGSRVGNSGFMKLSRLESPPNTQPFARGSPLPASDGQVLVRTPVDRPCTQFDGKARPTSAHHHTCKLDQADATSILQYTRNTKPDIEDMAVSHTPFAPLAPMLGRERARAVWRGCVGSGVVAWRGCMGLRGEWRGCMAKATRV
jgi:hypothetical protein